MEYPLDRRSPVPLYHQLAEGIRWRISTGGLEPGDRLPPVRRAAAELGVNMHTVRKAYAQLCEDGLAESAGRRGTFVLGRGRESSAATEPSDELERYLVAVARQARERFGLAPVELGRRLASMGGAGRPTVHVVECSESQCSDHAAEIEAGWQVTARPWSLNRPGEPPAGPLLATYFHYGEILRRWPQRRIDLHFLPIHVDPELPHRLAHSDRLLACELDEDKARNLESDLMSLFPPGTVDIGALTITPAAAALAHGDDKTLLCFAPRAWAELTAEERQHPRARKVRYVFDTQALAQLGEELGWLQARAA